MSFPSSTVAFFERIGGGGGDLGQREKSSQDTTGEALHQPGGTVDVSTSRVRLESHPRALLIASLANLGISFNVVNIDLAIKILRELHTESAAGESLVKAAAIFGMMAGQVIFGTLGDIVGRELALSYTLLVCFLGAAGSALTFGESVFHQLFFWRIVLGIGAGGVYPLAATLARASGVRFFNRGAHGGTDGDDQEDSGGTAVAIMFSMQGVGYLIARVTGYALVCLLPDNMEMAWRLLLGLGAVPPLMVVAIIGLSFAQERHYDLLRVVEGERGEREASLDGPHASNLVRVWMALPEKNRLIHKLIGTAGSWFLFDVTFYGNQLYQGDVLEGVFGAAQTARAEAAQHIALELVGLPGYFVTVALVSSMGPKRIQVLGFIVCAILFACLGLGFEPLKRKSYVLLGIYSLTFFFANFGPNSTTFILPSLTFPDQVRASLNGVSAAAGKLGAFAGSLLFKEAVTVLEGVGPVLVICALFSLAGGALTMAFVQTDDEEPVVVFADQGSNVDDDFLELPGSEHGEPGTNGHGPTGGRIAPGEVLSMSDQLSREHTPIKGTYRRVEGTTEIGQEYGVFNQAGISTSAIDGVFNGGNEGNRSVNIGPPGATSRTNPV